MQDDPIDPEARRSSGEKAEMTSMLDGQQSYVRVCVNGWVIEDLERDERIVLGLHKQRWNANTVEEVL